MCGSYYAGTHPNTFVGLDIFAMRKFLSPEYHVYACGKNLRMLRSQTKSLFFEWDLYKIG